MVIQTRKLVRVEVRVHSWDARTCFIFSGEWACRGGGEIPGVEGEFERVEAVEG